MTEDLWNEWKQRVDSTKKIFLFVERPDGKIEKDDFSVFNSELGDILVKAIFSDDDVIIIKNYGESGWQEIQKLMKTEIASVEYN